MIGAKISINSRSLPLSPRLVAEFRSSCCRAHWCLAPDCHLYMQTSSVMSVIWPSPEPLIPTNCCCAVLCPRSGSFCCLRVPPGSMENHWLLSLSTLKLWETGGWGGARGCTGMYPVAISTLVFLGIASQEYHPLSQLSSFPSDFFLFRFLQFESCKLN